MLQQCRRAQHIVEAAERRKEAAAAAASWAVASDIAGVLQLATCWDARSVAIDRCVCATARAATADACAGHAVAAAAATAGAATAFGVAAVRPSAIYTVVDADVAATAAAPQTRRRTCFCAWSRSTARRALRRVTARGAIRRANARRAPRRATALLRRLACLKPLAACRRSPPAHCGRVLRDVTQHIAAAAVP
eukprot:356061-Chlamydomonas_euryale.AAC.3